MKSTVEGNKELDFKVLEKAASLTLDKLRVDETHTDLYDQFQYRPDIAGCQRYFIEPYKSAWGSLVEQFDFIPLPQVILEQYSNVECASFMGIIPEINRVWVTVDNKLYIWNYYHPEECQVFDAISEVIVSVSLSAPKPGVFMDNVKYVLVVASPIEVVVLAVSCDENRRNLRLIPTIYKLPSDNVTMFKIIGSQSGRVFMAGNDGNLYELDYTNANRSWASAIGVEPPHKCRKINRFAWNWKLIHILPPFLRAITSNTEDSLAELAVDNVRNVLYLSTSKGVLSVFYLGPNGDESHFIVTSFNIFEECRSFLSNNRNTPDSSPKADCFMDSNTSASNFVVVALHVIPLIESRKAHLLVVLGNGIRIYLSLRSGHSGLYTRVPTATNQSAGPSALEIAYVRSPPSLNAVKFSNVVQQCVRVDESTASEVENGSVPSFTPSQSMSISNALYSHGTLLMSIDKSKQPDELLCVYEDHLYRAASGAPNANMYQPPTLKEGISVILDGSNSGGKIYDIKEDCSIIHTEEMAQMLALFTHSATPSTNSAIRDSSHHYQPNGRPSIESLENNSNSEEGYSSSDYPVTHSHALAGSPQTGLLGTAGYDRNNLDNVAVLSELTHQMIPSTRSTLQRQFLVLTNQGLHIFKKLRPIDVLYRNLAHLHNVSDELTRYFFTSFNPVQASAMCIALSCGVPCDAGGSGHVDPSIGALCSTAIPLEAVQKRAMSVMFALTSGPTHREAISGLLTNSASSSALKDSRVVLSGSTPEFINSVGHDALFLTFGRLIRPVWLRPLLHDTSVDAMWSIPLITQIRAPLLHFLNVLKGFFPVAVLTDPHKIDFLTTLDEIPSDHLITGQLHARAKSNVNVERTLQQKAKSLEDISINSLYRLASRTCHALSFLEILLTMTQEWHIPVDWSRLGDISFKTLVTSSRLHDRVKKMINIIINSVSRYDKIQIADRLIDWLSNECYHFFSAGDRYVYEASKLLEALRKLLSGDQANNGTVFSLSVSNQGDIKQGEVQSLSTHCVQLLCNAAKYWHTLESVNAGGDEELNTKCSELLELNSEIGRDGVVDLCLLVSENFRVKPDRLTSRVFSSRSITDVENSEAVAVLDNTSFDASFYHGGTLLTDQDRTIGIKACYTCLINHIIAVGRDVPHLGEGMVGPNANRQQFDPLVLALRSMHAMILRAVNKCNDDLFHDMLYATLYQENRDQLFLIRTTQVERFLKETDPTTLYSYYEHHKEHTKAANLMSILAHEPTDVDIELRINFLQKAVASAEKATSLSKIVNKEYPPEQVWLEDSPEYLEHKVVTGLFELKDTLDIAGYQVIAHKKLSDDFSSYHFNSVNKAKFNESQRKQLEQMERQVHRLKNQLVGITELFHECMLYRLWDVCLMLLNISKHNDQDLIARLWRSFIYRIVPDNAMSEEIQNFLRLKREPNRIDTDKRHQRSDVTFEDATQWKATLENELTQLGQALHTSVIAFPVVTILDELEEIASVLSIYQPGATPLFEKGWAYHCFISMGFSHVIILNSYMELFDMWGGKSPEKLLHVIVSVTAVLLRWTRKAIERDSASINETRQLIQYARSGTVRTWLERIRRLISTISTRGTSLADQQLLEDTNNQILEVNRRVNELTYV